jgi:hypothetical protein
MTPRLLTVAVLGLLLALLLCLIGIIYLAAAVPAKAIPDVLVGTTGIIVGAIAGLLAPRSAQ